jgi:DNA mismatch repair protein MutS
LKALGDADPFFEGPHGRSALQAAELLLVYVAETQGHLPAHLRPPRPHATDHQLMLDATTIRHLDLVSRGAHRQAETHLVGLMDQSRSAMGGRTLRSMILAPSLDAVEIGLRHDAVEALVALPALRAEVRAYFSSAYDIERLTARAASGRISPRELGNLRGTLGGLPALRQSLVDSGQVPLQRWAENMALHRELFEELDRALVDEPPLNAKDGIAIREGYDGILDEAVALSLGGRNRIAAMEAEERQATGIPTLKVKYTRVFGFYLEVTKAHLAKVPAHYRRKQTVATAERYVTEALSRLEEEVAGAEARKVARESVLLEALQTRVVNEARALVASAAGLGKMDALAAFAEVAERHRHTRPELLPMVEGRIHLESARHPLVEAAAEGESFVPSDILLDAKETQILLVTGPNMAGKSTVMRQVALNQILAQAGAFVPAKRARLSICDRIFTRVGAGDDLVMGRSTFMVEMNETAHILRHATPHSLILLDEIGRGTSTFDGLSLAWAVVEHLHDHVGARTLFATHYHELTALADGLARVHNTHVEVKEWNGEVVFVRTLAPGPSERSYGIHVAHLAGLPAPVLDRARTILGILEGDVVWDEAHHGPAPKRPLQGRASEAQGDLFRSENTSLPPRAPLGDPAFLSDLGQVDVNELTPLQAMNELAKWVARARSARDDQNGPSGAT